MPDGTPKGANGALIHHTARTRLVDLIASFPQGLRLIAGNPQQRFSVSTCIEPLLAVVDDPGIRSCPHYCEEHFGPLLIVDAYDDLDDCLNRLASNRYRLATSIFTSDHARFLQIAQDLPYGQVNHNRPTAGARSDMPFGGIGAAGNGHPAAVAAGAIFADECVVW
jgi:acyl-CoA reductase-like NAD-dependent aldehyde dehydrogenase